MRTSLDDTVGAGTQLSTAVATPVSVVEVPAPQSTVLFAGQVIVGATLSLIVMICAQVDAFPQRSVALKVRVTVNLFTQLTLLVTSLTKPMVVAPPQLSVAVTPVVVCAGIEPAHAKLMFAGQVMLGAMLSNTVIVCVQVAVLLHRSLAMKVRVTVNLLAQSTLLV